MRVVSRLAIAGFVVFLALQLVRPGIPTRAATAEVEAPANVKRMLEEKCYSCHSNERRLSWFDEIVPGYWLVRHDILMAREHLNFSTLGLKPAGAQRATLFEGVNMIQLGAMPLPAFVQLHPEARVTAQELADLKAYLDPWGASPPSSALPPKSAASLSRVNLSSVRPELNGLPFDTSFEGWKVLSTTDRGDNNTFRFILGNNIAFEAARSGKISPWPDGSRLAKIAWPQELGADGLVRPGEFIQVELMVKDAKRYKETEGWGWGRWRGLDLKPYGKDAAFVSECTTCHLPVRGNDYVYTLPITQARADGREVVNNAAAALPASLPYQPLGWGAITMYVDPKSHTTAILFGNDTAIHSLQAAAGPSVGVAKLSAYPAGSVLGLVTWAQRDDPHWFGARIPDAPQSVEFVHVTTGKNEYRRFSGAGLGEDTVPADGAVQRLEFILGLAPVQLP